MSNFDSRLVAEFNVHCWQSYPQPINHNLVPSATNDPSIPKSLQRRLSPLAKIVFQTIAPCIDIGEQIPAVFCSSHGEIVRSLSMLQTMKIGEELSPTAFSLSVHNAIAGLFSIAFDNRQEITTLAPGQDGIASGFIEALGLLQEKHSEVFLVFYDEPVPEFFPIAPFQLNPPSPYVLAIKLAASGAGLPIRFMRIAAEPDIHEQPLQIPLFVNFLLSKQLQLQLGPWQWQKV